MKCPKCGAENAPLKKCCYRCGTILSGYTINNVTGEYGYRNPDGTFTKEPKQMIDTTKFTAEEIAGVKQRVDEAVEKMAAVPFQLPDEVESTINDAVKRMEEDIISQCGDNPLATLPLPMYREMMRLGALMAMVYGEAESNQRNQRAFGAI